MASLQPDSEQLSMVVGMGTDEGKGEPVTMLNVLRFKDPAEYARYSSAMAPIMKRLGMSVVWSGLVDGVVIGSEEKMGGPFHAVALVRYPSREAFLRMTTQDKEYRAVHRFRKAGLESQYLIACSDMPAGGFTAAKL